MVYCVPSVCPQRLGGAEEGSGSAAVVPNSIPRLPSATRTRIFVLCITPSFRALNPRLGVVPRLVSIHFSTSDNGFSVTFAGLDFARLLAPLTRRAAYLLYQAAPAAWRPGFVQPRRPRRRTS